MKRASQVRHAYVKRYFSSVSILESLFPKSCSNPSDEHKKDWTGAFSSNPSLILQPENTQQLSEMLQVCNQHLIVCK